LLTQGKTQGVQTSARERRRVVVDGEVFRPVHTLTQLHCFMFEFDR